MVIGGKNTAFLRETAGGKSRRVLQGDTVNGILVADVKPDRVRLALGDESEELVLRVVTNPRPTVQPAAPAPAAAPRPRGCARVAPAPAGTAAAQPAGTADTSLAERRRAARAAQAAVQSQTSTPDGNPIPIAGACPAPRHPTQRPLLPRSHPRPETRPIPAGRRCTAPTSNPEPPCRSVDGMRSRNNRKTTMTMPIPHSASSRRSCARCRSRSWPARRSRAAGDRRRRFQCARSR